MSKKYIIGILILIGVGFGLYKFTPVGSYFSNSGSYDTKLDSLFLGIHFGMTNDAFFAKCKELNKTLGAIQGTQNTSVMYIDKENFKLPVHINFYPLFNAKREIMSMPMYFNYEAWAPWNKELNSDILITDVVVLLEKWFGSGFKSKKLESGRVGYYKKDGARIITAKARDEQFVDVMIENSKYVDPDDENPAK